MHLTAVREHVRQLDLSPVEATAAAAVVDSALIDADTDEELVRRARILAGALPLRLREQLEGHRLDETSAVVHVRGGIGVEPATATPAHWAHRDPVLLPHGAFLLLVSALLGDAFGWALEQDGRIVQDLMPIRGDEDRQISSSSRAELTWHTDEAFHPMRCDYVALVCLRNRDRVPTSVAVPDLSALDADLRAVLHEPRFAILPEASHLRPPEPDADAELGAASRRVHELARRPPLVPLLFGDPQDPYLCWDSAYTDLERLDPVARRAHGALEELIEDARREVVLEPGDLLFIDNLRCAHSRGAFEARYDGTDRWLQRVYVTRDLRKSRALRSGAGGRVLH
jgi:Fe(II)/alpha-ketoglutarate-dependent arginine beta-hydroxylase